MKKVMLIMVAALLMLTQCKKENETPNGPAEGTMKMTVTAGPGRTDINTENGAITWSANDKLYVSDGSNWLGSLTLASGAGTANGTFMGDIESTGENLTTCYFFYLGHDNVMTVPTGSNAAIISMAAQDGTLAGAIKYHLGCGNTSVTVTEGEAKGNVIMKTKIAIAHINFTNGTSAYTGSLTMGGTGISNTMTVSPDGTFTGGGNGGINIGATTTGEKYVTLIPATGVVSANFTGDAIGSMTFLTGIHENKFYGMSNAMAVTVKIPVFSVGETTKVKFAPGNLYWDDLDSEWKFEANQWSTTPTSDGTWNPNHLSHFFWSKNSSVAVASSYSGQSASTDDTFFTNASDFQVSGETGWRTLSDAEWDYLFDRKNSSDPLTGSVYLDNSFYGRVFLPDGTENPATVLNSIKTTADLATYGAVFLPYAGKRDGESVIVVEQDAHGTHQYGYYWSSTPDGANKAYRKQFQNLGMGSNADSRSLGYSVRLVRDITE